MAQLKNKLEKYSAIEPEEIIGRNVLCNVSFLA
jgi:hypothetical protein